MSCREVHSDLALLVGQDLNDPQRERAVRRHLLECPRCRLYEAQLALSREALLQSASDAVKSTDHRSVWPRVAAQLEAMNRPGEVRWAGEPSRRGLARQVIEHPAWVQGFGVLAAAAILLAVALPQGPGAVQSAGVTGSPAFPGANRSVALGGDASRDGSRVLGRGDANFLTINHGARPGLPAPRRDGELVAPRPLTPDEWMSLGVRAPSDAGAAAEMLDPLELLQAELLDDPSEQAPAWTGVISRQPSARGEVHQLVPLEDHLGLGPGDRGARR